MATTSRNFLPGSHRVPKTHNGGEYDTRQTNVCETVVSKGNLSPFLVFLRKREGWLYFGSLNPECTDEDANDHAVSRCSGQSDTVNT